MVEFLGRGREGGTKTEVSPEQMMELQAMALGGSMEKMPPEMRADMEWAEAKLSKLRAN